MLKKVPPTNATGGCLCGAIRYNVNFPPGHDFAANSAKCFCTACRKQSGALLLHLHAVPISAFSCVAPESVLGDYSAIPGCHRLFCKRCGAFIAWQQDPQRLADIHGSADDGSKLARKRGAGVVMEQGGRVSGIFAEEGEVEICVGTLDEEFLVGRRGDDRNVVPGTGFGGLLAHPEGRVLYAENDIPGVTDLVTGVRYKYGTEAGVKMVPES